MRVLALVTEAYGGPGGIAQYNRDFFAALAAAQPDGMVDVLPRYAPGPPGAAPKGIVQHRARPGKLAYAVAAVSLALSRRPSVVFCGHLFTAPLAYLIHRLTGARLVVQLHGIEIWKPPSAAMLKALRAASLVLCVSRDTRGRLLAYCNMAPERAAVLPNTVQSTFSPGGRAEARARFGLKGELTLVSVSRLDARESYKGHDRVIAALPLVAAQDRSVVYLIAGDGDDRPRLERLAAAEGVSERVRFLGYVPEADLPDLYRAADCFVLPSSGEGFGIVFLEAMACGAPAVGLAAGGASDALGEAALAPDVDAEGLAGEILRQAKIPATARRTLAQDVVARYGQPVFQSRLSAIWRAFQP